MSHADVKRKLGDDRGTGLLGRDERDFSAERLLTLDTVTKSPKTPAFWDQVAVQDFEEQSNLVFFPTCLQAGGQGSESLHIQQLNPLSQEVVLPFPLYVCTLISVHSVKRSH
jgi:hypothetical protein